MEVNALCLGDWVETHTELDRRGREFTVALNRRTSAIILLDDDLPPQELAVELRRGGFLNDAVTPVPAPPVGNLRGLLRTFDIRWTGADRLVAAIHSRGVKHAWSRRSLAAQIAIAAWGVVALTAALRSGRPTELRPDPWHVPLYIGISLVSVAIHELGHAVVLSHNQRRVSSVGFRLHLGAPAFYVESTEALLLPRRQRLLQAAAGPWAEWLFLALAASVLWAMPDCAFTPVLHRFVILGAITIFTNLLPFSGLDGSLLLAELIREPNLAADSKRALQRLLVDRRRADLVLVAYALANTVVSSMLLLSSLVLWYFVFGGLIAVLVDHGPIGGLAAAALIGVSFGPALFAAASWLRRITFFDRIAFRLERRARVRFTERLASVAPFDRLDPGSLGVLAGQLDLRRIGRGCPLHAPAFRGFLAVDRPVAMLGDHIHVAPGVHRIDNAGINVTNRRRFRSARGALLPECSLRLLGLEA